MKITVNPLHNRRHRLPGLMILLFLVLAAAAAILTACDVFFYPLGARTNPLDPNAPVQNLKAVPLSANQVELSWSLPSENPPDTIYFVRSSSSKPLNKEDGEVLPDITISNLSYIDTVDPNSNYYYACWVGHGSADTGPLQLKTGTFSLSKQIPLTVDGYLDDLGTRDFAATAMPVSGDGAVATSRVLLKFSSSHFPNNVLWADFSFDFSFAGFTLDFYPVTQSWESESLDWTTVDSGGFYDPFYTASIPATVVGPNSVELTGVLQGMLEYGNGENGILVESVQNGTGSMSSLESGIPPELNVDYYGPSE